MRTPNQVAGERVRAIRDARGLTLRDLATRLQALGLRIHHNGIGSVEKGIRRLDVSELFAFAYALDVSPLHLMVPADDDAGGVAVTPDVILTKSGNLRRWMRGHVPLAGQRGSRYYEIAVPRSGDDYDSFMVEQAEHNRLVQAADDLRDAVARRDSAEVAHFLREVFKRAHDVARRHMTEEDENRFIHGIEVIEGEDE
jgi:transcriptional regulator with XRE-family HTH domain